MKSITDYSLYSTDGVFRVYNRVGREWRLNRGQKALAWILGVTVGAVIGLLLAVLFIEDHMLEKVPPEPTNVIYGWVELSDWQTCWQNCSQVDYVDAEQNTAAISSSGFPER